MNIKNRIGEVEKILRNKYHNSMRSQYHQESYISILKEKILLWE